MAAPDSDSDSVPIMGVANEVARSLSCATMKTTATRKASRSSIEPNDKTTTTTYVRTYVRSLYLSPCARMCVCIREREREKVREERETS